MSPAVLHPEFKFNGQARDAGELHDLAERLGNRKEPEQKHIRTFLKDWLGPEDFITARTSGSTGMPREIRLQKRHMTNSARATGAYFDLPAGSTALLCLSAGNIAGKMMLVRAMVLGWDLYAVLPSSTPLERIGQKFDFAAMVPLQVEHSIGALHRVKKLIVGGAGISQKLREKLTDLPTRAFSTFGMTETVSHIAVQKLNHLDKDDRPDHYRALPGVTLSTDEQNHLMVDAPQLADGTIATNDVVKLHDPTSFEWLGRADNAINSGGIKVHPEHVEARIDLPNPFFIASEKDKKLGEKVILLIEGKEQPLPPDTFDGLHRYERPKKTYWLPSFSYTRTGKIRRAQTLTLITS